MYLPDLEDNRSHYIYQPYQATLYGCTQRPHMYLRVVEYLGSDIYDSITMFDDPSDPNSASVIHSVDLRTFLMYASFGYTPYIEALFSKQGYRGIDADNIGEYVLTQAVYRNYEARISTLLEECERKRYSIASSSVSNASTMQLVDEAIGALACWEILTNMGVMRPDGVVANSDLVDHGKMGGIPLNEMRKRFDELGARQFLGNCHALKYKMNDAERRALLAGYGVS